MSNIKEVVIEIGINNKNLYKKFIPYFQVFNKGLNGLGIIPTVTIRNDVETIKTIGE